MTFEIRYVTRKRNPLFKDKRVVYAWRMAGIPTRAEAKRDLRRARKLFPDARVTLHEVAGDGDA